MHCAGLSLRPLTVGYKILIESCSRPIHQTSAFNFASYSSDKYQNLWSEDFDSIYCAKMPKSKESHSSSDDSSHSSSEDEKPKKKQKVEKSRHESKEEKSESSKKTKTSSKAREEEPCWELGNKKRLKVRTFKGKLYVDIREYYGNDAGELNPSKKGISLQAPQFEELMKIIHEVEDVVKIKLGN
ncbi:activated RNA polymerase II transcriptional coactivator p15 [Fopius arisanus]|uniref:Activated RNA polymerase II transcriptional coactivator p15 n=1 Tax=Fopius arisanus TaxID=64838 RepID=A0A9R1T6S2_9HYME|nr:PREDICTED: activated RNA polymerase II transcriptional coactivator p15-like [Fopius arisanus]